MTAAITGHGQPWSEEDFLGLGETLARVELFDGSLYLTAPFTPRHQTVSRRLANALDPGAEKAGLHVLEAVNVRLKPGRVPIPDVVITGDIDFDDAFVPGSAVRLVCEIVSPSNASVDRVLKMHYYSAAGIEWYLLIEQDTATLHLYRLHEGRYREHSVTRPGEILTLTDPVPAEIDPGALLPHR